MDNSHARINSSNINEVLEGDESCAMILLKSLITYKFPPYFPLAISARFAPDFSAATYLNRG